MYIFNVPDVLFKVVMVFLYQPNYISTGCVILHTL